MAREDYLDDIHLRVQRVTEDLRAIQRELNCAAMEAAGDPELLEALTQLPEMDSLQVLKSVVDQMRHFLWFYMQVMTNESETGERLRQSIRQKVSADAVVSPEGGIMRQEIYDYVNARPRLGVADDGGIVVINGVRRIKPEEIPVLKSPNEVSPKP